MFYSSCVILMSGFIVSHRGEVLVLSSSVLFKLCYSDVWISYLTEERLLLVLSSSVLFKLCYSDVWI